MFLQMCKLYMTNESFNDDNCSSADVGSFMIVCTWLLTTSYQYLGHHQTWNMTNALNVVYLL